MLLQRSSSRIRMSITCRHCVRLHLHKTRTITLWQSVAVCGSLWQSVLLCCFTHPLFCIIMQQCLPPQIWEMSGTVLKIKRTCTSKMDVQLEYVTSHNHIITINTTAQACHTRQNPGVAGA